ELLEGEAHDLLGGHLQGTRELRHRNELGDPHQRLLALLLVAPLLLFDFPEARALFAAVHAFAGDGTFDRGERARDVLRHRLLIHQRLLALLALLALLPSPLFERTRARRGRGDGARGSGHGATGRRAGHRLGADGRGGHGPWLRWR